MLTELIKDKVYYKIFDRTFKASTSRYARHKYSDATNLAEVDKNIEAVKAEFMTKNLKILDQVHGREIIYTNSENCEILHAADGLITKEKDIVLGVLTADCVPVLFTSSDGETVGAAHCGWKGAKANIIKTIYEMMVNDHKAKDIKAIIGPSIAQNSYEVDALYYKSFIDEAEHFHEFFIPSQKDGHYMFNLNGFVKQKLQELNIEIVKHIDEDTYSMPKKYPSYRRSCHGLEEYYQNILSAIVIR